MEFQSIFTIENRANLWAVCYPEDCSAKEKIDIFSKKFKLWANTEYIQNYLKDNEKKILDPFWEGISPDEALDQIMDERLHFENELNSIENNVPGYEDITLKDIFKPLHTNIYSLNWNKEQHRKGKPNFSKPMIRLYAIELSDGTIVITGGAIKLTKKMIGDEFDIEMKNLERVQIYLEQEGINSKEGLFY